MPLQQLQIQCPKEQPTRYLKRPVPELQEPDKAYALRPRNGKSNVQRQPTKDRKNRFITHSSHNDYLQTKYSSCQRCPENRSKTGTDTYCHHNPMVASGQTEKLGKTVAIAPPICTPVPSRPADPPNRCVRTVPI